MSRKSEFKENCESKPAGESCKRMRMGENVTFSKTQTEIDDDSNASVTIYEDDSDISFVNKSTKSRHLGSSQGKRSPLVVINAATVNSSNPAYNQVNYQAGPSTAPIKQNEIAKRPPVPVVRPRQAQPAPDVDYISQLSDEMFLHIFQYLPKKTLNRIATVNCRFSRIIQDETLWIRLDLGFKVVRTGALEIIIKRGVVILRLAMAKFQLPVFEPSFQPELFHQVNKLHYLDLSMSNIDKDSLYKLLKSCRHLQKLSLEFVPLGGSICTAIADCVGINTLNLAMCEGLSRDGITRILTSLVNLNSLNIAWTNLSLRSVDMVAERLPEKVARLNISGCRKTLLDRHIKRISERCVKIDELDVSDCTMLTSACIPFFFNFKEISYISLSRCYNININAYETLNQLKSLKFFDLFGLLSPAGVESIEHSFPGVGINKFVHSSIARPTVAPRRTSIWGSRTRD